MSTDGEVGRDLADEATGELRTEPPDLLSPIDETAPVSGHRPPLELVTAAAAPEHDWAAAKSLVFPLFRPPGTHGMSPSVADSISLADSPTTTEPIVTPGPAGLAVVYGIAAQGFAVLVNVEHLLSWGIGGADLHDAAIANLAAWSKEAEWVEERAGDRRLLSSSTGDGYDAVRLLLPEVRGRLTELSAGAPPGTRILVGVPDRDLLVAGPLSPGDDEFAALFGDFLAEQSASAVEPIDSRILELRGTELIEFAG